jgi:16S rRNA (cytidine1402-2'-O)-methyltransferase
MKIPSQEMFNALYMIPVTLGDAPVDAVIPPGTLNIMNELDHFIVEDLRTARRYLRKAGYKIPFDDVHFFILNEHSSEKDLDEMMEVLINGQSMGMMSEAGAPGIADPGREIVALAHRNGIRVIPLAGPSSILMGLMASGLNGQSFTFHGYLPVKNPDRSKRIRQLERTALETGVTQIFMETPYRNMSLLEDLLKLCGDDTMLGIAADISLTDEFIRTRSVLEWRRSPPSIQKRPAVFLLNRIQP